MGKNKTQTLMQQQTHKSCNTEPEKGSISMVNTLLDNTTEQLSMSETIKYHLRDSAITEMMIATGYWDLAGLSLIFDELSSFILRGGKLRLLIGKEPQIRPYQLNGSKSDKNKFPDFYIKRDIGQLSDEYKPIIQFLLDYCFEDEQNSPIQIHVYGQNGDKEKFLHAKCYIFNGKGIARGIIGSSNFTQKGLKDNEELNYLETTPHIVAFKPTGLIQQKGHAAWFEEKWDNSEPWNGVFIKDIIKTSPIGKKIIKEQPQLTPYDIFIKYLQLQFSDIVDENSNTRLSTYLPADFNPLEYQFDAVKQCISIMKQHGGFILADVVGMGKTVVGLLIIRQFLDEICNRGHDRKVLIVVPPAIKQAWIDTIEAFDKDTSHNLVQSIDFVTTGSIKHLIEEDNSDIAELSDTDELEMIQPKTKYGLILIDESHRFRNASTNMYKTLENVIFDISCKSGNYPYIGLLSATPQNNSPRDLKNQIYLFQHQRNKSTLPKIEGGRLDSFFNRKQIQFNEIIKKKKGKETPEEEKILRQNELIAISKEIREKVLDDLVVRRTRTDIKTHYPNDSQRLKFPTIGAPHKVEYFMDEQLSKLFFDTMEIIAPTNDDDDEFDLNSPKGLGYYRYRAIEFIKDSEISKLYSKGNLTAEKISERLARIMQILLVKRLESSFAAFKESLLNLQRYTQNMLDMIANDCVFICPDIDVNKELNIAEKERKKGNSVKITIQDCFNDIRLKMEKLKKQGKESNNIEIKANKLDPTYKTMLEGDKEKIDELCRRWNVNDYDPKLEAFKEHLTNAFFNAKINNPHEFDKPRLVIFTEAISTLNSIKRHTENKGYRVLGITAANRDDMQAVIKANFDANAKPEEKKEDYDVLITTEVLAEGVNLHRSNVILNYDTPWNSTRLMQRIGRVNRIGSKEEFVHVFNFFPSMQGDAQINLVKRTYIKLQAFHTMFGEDNKVFSDEEELSDANFSRLVDGEESPFERYIALLKAFNKNNPQRYNYLLTLNDNVYAARKAEASETLFVLKANNSGMLNVNVFDAHKAQELSTLETIEKLKCEPNEPAVDNISIDEKAVELAKNKFVAHFDQMQTAKGSDKRIVKALKIIHDEIYPRVNTQSKACLNQVVPLIKKGNISIAESIITLTATPDLFGADYNINEYIQATFKNISKRVSKRIGEPRVILSEKQIK